MLKDVVLMHREDFIAKISQLMQKEKLSVFEAIIEVCKEYEIDPEDITPLIKGSLKEKLKHELIALNILPNTTGNTIQGI